VNIRFHDCTIPLLIGLPNPGLRAGKAGRTDEFMKYNGSRMGDSAEENQELIAKAKAAEKEIAVNKQVLEQETSLNMEKETAEFVYYLGRGM
jgi:hypothetical protein